VRGAGPLLRIVFVDTSFYVAFVYPRDAHHREALTIARELAMNRVGLTTTNVVAIETHSLVLARAGRDAALRALQRIYATRELLHRVDEADERRAMAILEQYGDKDFSFADATSFAVMERLGINTAVAFDRHFVQFGWQVLGSE
jgi:predicted nucleic acid-binding protein